MTEPPPAGRPGPRAAGPADVPALGREDLRTPFARTGAPLERVGLEIENGLVDPETGRAARYEGPRGVRAVLATALAEWDGEPQTDTGRLTGVTLPDGSQLSLEHGGQLEYSSAPVVGLGRAVTDAETALRRLAVLADRFGLALLPGAQLPFERPDTVSWVPMSRGAVMRDYFARTGEPAARATTIMSMSLSTQVHLDHLSAADFTRKLRMLVAAAPVVAALLVNSPIAGGRSNGMLSHRSYNWLRMDPRRCGLLRPALRPDVSVDDLVDWALRLPMIYYRTADGRYRLAPDRPFADLLTSGFDDGTTPTPAHWAAHLSQIWTDVRVRRTFELRSADGPPHHGIPALPALWVGLGYHPPSCQAAWQLLRHHTAGEYQALLDALPSEGLRARLGDSPVGELAAELLRLARAGLTARVRTGLEPPEVLAHLDPLDEILATGRTFAEQCLARWEGDLRGDPRRYVAAYRVRAR
ncbi:glutamate-cysteine ligase family protein [Kitasatospora sp. NPDC058218]|uniref:glutamate-cysteine ligase family protein n=1 Tax=Kitasatospora sp. NPDC058218 TaxID=3346385 RepID=UPI0036DC5E7F